MGVEGLKRIYLWFCLAGLAMPLCSQRFHIRTYGQSEGLFTSLVSCGLRTPDGYAWFGTPGGLLRFDGVRFHPLRIEDGLISNGVRHILLHDDGLWIGTAAGFTRFDGRAFRVPQGGTKAMVTAMARHKGKIWVATGDGCLYRGDDKGFEPLPLERGDGHICDLKSYSGHLWALFSQPEKRFFVCLDGKQSDGPIWSFDGLQPRFLCVWDGILWAGTRKGLVPLVGKKAEVQLPGKALTAAWADGRGRLWLGSENEGVTILGPDFHCRLDRENGLGDSHVQSIFGDQEGLVWICTSRGISKVVSLAYRGYLPDMPVMAMVEYGGEYWFATDESGIRRGRPEDGFAQILGVGQGLSSERVRALAVFRGRLYAGTRSGLCVWDGKRFQPWSSGPLNEAYVLNLQVMDDRLWVSTVRFGVLVIGAEEMHRYDTAAGLPSNTAWSVALQGERVWIATEGGLCGVEADGRSRIFGRKEGLCCDQIRALWYDSPQRTLWVATGNGLNSRQDGAEQWLSYTRRNGLDSPLVSALLAVGSDLWMGTEQGVFILSAGRIHPGPGKRSGLLGGEECSGVAGMVHGRDGVIWYLSTSGVSAIDTNLVSQTLGTVPVQISRMSAGETILDLPPVAPLSRRQNDLSFSYSSLSMAEAQRILYRTRLEGADSGWSEPTEATSVRYARLRGGDYRLRVQAKLGETGPWSPEATLSFRITKRFAERTWVMLLALLLFVWASYWVVKLSKQALGAISFFRRVRYIGHFKVLETIGSGGMGVVYKAVDQLNSGRIVALKVLRDEHFVSENDRRRFQLEGSIIDQFDHPGIVHNLERGELEGSLYIAMEYVDGIPLSQVLREGGRLGFSRAAGLMAQLLDVLHHLHQKGVLHRDLKPDNLMVSKTLPERIKLLDFGLALREAQTRLTQTGTVMGTLHYLPPERILSGVSGTSGDIYAAGVLFYEMVAGRRPFEEEGLLEVMKAIVDGVFPPPNRFCPDLPPSMNQLIVFMLDKDPARRPSALEAMEILSLLHPD